MRPGLVWAGWVVDKSLDFVFGVGTLWALATNEVSGWVLYGRLVGTLWALDRDFGLLP